MRKISVVVSSLLLAGGTLAAVAVADGGHATVKKSAAVPPASGPSGTDHAAAKARCPDGMRPEAIGVSAKPHDDLNVVGLRLSDSKTARAALGSFNSSAQTVTSIAYCAKNAPKTTVRSNTVTVGDSTGSDKPSSVKASCKGDERVMFGGFKQPDGDSNLYLAGQRRSGQAWITDIYNFEAPVKVTTYAYCSKDAPKLSTAKLLTSVPGDSTSTLKPKCHDGKHVVSGGYTGEVTNSNAFILLRTLQRKGSKAFKVVVHNDNPGDIGDLTAFAYCAKS